MKVIELKIPPELSEEFSKNSERHRAWMVNALSQKLTDESALGRLELVQVIKRCKARVWNWNDLEREIMRGAIGAP